MMNRMALAGRPFLVCFNALLLVALNACESDLKATGNIQVLSNGIHYIGEIKEHGECFAMMAGEATHELDKSILINLQRNNQLASEAAKERWNEFIHLKDAFVMAPGPAGCAEAFTNYTNAMNKWQEISIEGLAIEAEAARRVTASDAGEQSGPITIREKWLCNTKSQTGAKSQEQYEFNPDNSLVTIATEGTVLGGSYAKSDINIEMEINTIGGQLVNRPMRISGQITTKSAKAMMMKTTTSNGISRTSQCDRI